MLCAYTRPRYQVSVYRIIGPLVTTFGKQKDDKSTLSLGCFSQIFDYR